MHEDKAAILFNPSAGKGKALKKKKQLEGLLQKHDIPYDLFITQSEEDLKKITGEKSKEYKVLVGAGGDSTFNIMIDEIIKRGADVTFGMIGLGSSNDIVKEFAVDSLDKACLALKKKRTKRIDLGCIVEDSIVLRHYLGQANVGLGVFVSKHAEDMASRGSKWARLQTVAGVSGIYDSYRSQKVPLSLTIKSDNGGIHGKFILASFNNFRYWATGRLLCPEAQPDDGKLDGCLIDHCSFSRFVHIALMAKKGNHIKAREVEILQSSEFTVSAEKTFEIQTDGGIVHRPDSSTQFRTVQFRILPQALTIIY
ncbi:MAG: diacylglycerol kinase family protein [Candidatus Aminicenantaceae bacterium]